jgi:hypothetical protein
MTMEENGRSVDYIEVFIAHGCIFLQEQEIFFAQHKRVSKESSFSFSRSPAAGKTGQGSAKKKTGIKKMPVSQLCVMRFTIVEAACFQ